MCNTIKGKKIWVKIDLEFYGGSEGKKIDFQGEGGREGVNEIKWNISGNS